MYLSDLDPYEADAAMCAFHESRLPYIDKSALRKKSAFAVISVTKLFKGTLVKNTITDMCDYKLQEYTGLNFHDLMQLDSATYLEIVDTVKKYMSRKTTDAKQIEKDLQQELKL